MVGITTGRDAELVRLRAENARLIGLLEARGIAWRLPEPGSVPTAAASLTTDEKVALFRRLFRGRMDVYPVRWENKAGKSGYSPACANEWRAGFCEKPRIKCADCGNRLLAPLTDQTIYDHLAGRHTVGVYPLLARMTAAISSLWISTTLIGAAMHRPSPNPVANRASPSHWKYHARATAPMRGFFSRRTSLHGMRGGSVPPSSATPAPAPGN